MESSTMQTETSTRAGPPDKPYLSPSQLDSYCRCPEAYRRRYLDKEIIPPGVAMLKGTGFHGAAKVNFKQKIESRRDLPVKEMVEAAVETFTKEVHGGLTLSEEEHARGSEIVIGEAKDDLAELVDVHARLQAPDYQPVFVEEKVRIVLPNAPRDLLGILDLADDKDRVTDFKTAAKKKSQSDADDSVQLSVYAAAFQIRTGRPPAEVRLDTAVQTKTKTDRQVLVSERGQNDFDALANRINAVTNAITVGSFPPATPGAWWCGPKWCGYWHTCPYVNNQRKALVQIGE